MRACEFCGGEEVEDWEGDSGLTGTRCVNKCWVSYKINMEKTESERRYERW